MILNRYKVTEDLVSETCRYTVRNRLRPIRILCLISILICLYLIAAVQKGMELPLVMAFVFMLLVEFLFLPVLEKQTAKKLSFTMQAKSRATYGKKPVWEEIRIENGQVTTYTNKVQAFSFPLSGLQKFYETDTLLIAIFRSGTVLTLRKDSFLSGSSEECRELFKAIRRHRN